MYFCRISRRGLRVEQVLGVALDDLDFHRQRDVGRQFLFANIIERVVGLQVGGVDGRVAAVPRVDKLGRAFGVGDAFEALGRNHLLRIVCAGPDDRGQQTLLAVGQYDVLAVGERPPQATL